MSDKSAILIDKIDQVTGDAAFLEAIGHHALLCHGPGEDSICPLLTGEGCSLLTEAHGILFELDLDQPQHRAILARYKQVVAEDVPIRVVIRPDQVGRYPELLRGLKVSTRSPGNAELDGLAAETEAAEYYLG
ncbi:MAG TPA: hypothetical protein VID03_11050 [Acidimicrobiia bacterium]|jgi:hypothetical protein